MVKGISRRVIVVDSPDPKLFEEPLPPSPQPSETAPAEDKESVQDEDDYDDFIDRQVLEFVNDEYEEKALQDFSRDKAASYDEIMARIRADFDAPPAEPEAPADQAKAAPAAPPAPSSKTPKKASEVADIEAELNNLATKLEALTATPHPETEDQ